MSTSLRAKVKFSHEFAFDALFGEKKLLRARTFSPITIEINCRDIYIEINFYEKLNKYILLLKRYINTIEKVWYFSNSRVI